MQCIVLSKHAMNGQPNPENSIQQQIRSHVSPLRTSNLAMDMSLNATLVNQSFDSFFQEIWARRQEKNKRRSIG
jgi:hypothetical protein